MSEPSSRGAWGSRLGFIFAAAGSAVGLGAIWKFPYVVGKNGGGAFLLVFFACVFSIGLALLMAEMLIGRMARRSATPAFRDLKGGLWPWAGVLSVLCLFVILSFYSVVGGWTVAYVAGSVSGTVMPRPGHDAATAFAAFIGNPWLSVLYTLAFLGVTGAVVMGGVEKGIERMSKILMPALFLLMLLLIARVLTLPGAMEGVRYFLTPDFGKLTTGAVVEALGLAFFSLSLGCGIIIAYGSYLEKSHRLVSSTLWVAVLATLACVLAGLMVLPAVFAFGMSPEAGPGLTFITMPVIFSKLPFGQGFAIAFFLLLFFAALTSAISLLESVVSYFIDDWRWSRRKAAWVAMLLIFLLSIPNALSFGVMSQPLLGSRTFFDIMDYLATNILMPAGGIVVALFVGGAIWQEVSAELHEEGVVRWQPLFRLTCVVLAPVMIAVIWYCNL